MSRSTNAVNLLQEVPKLRRSNSGKLSYDLNGLALSFLQTKATEQETRLQAIEEMLAAIYLRLDEIRGQVLPAPLVSEERLPGESRGERAEGAPSSSPPPLLLPWWRRLWLELVAPASLRRNPPY